MTTRERIEAHLATRSGLCDDCLARELGVSRRQNVRNVCAKSSTIHCSHASCLGCGKNKIVRLLDADSPTAQVSRPLRKSSKVARYLREDDLRTRFNDSIATTLGVAPNDYYRGIGFTGLLELKATFARIHDLVTLKLALALVSKLGRRCDFDGEAIERMRQAISCLHPNVSGFDLDSSNPNVIGEVKGCIPVNEGSSFGAAQIKGLTNDVLQMLGRPPRGKSEEQLSPRAKILRPNRAEARKFVGLYDSPKVRDAAAQWRKSLLGSGEWKSLSPSTIQELPDTGELTPTVVYLVFLKPDVAFTSSLNSTEVGK